MLQHTRHQKARRLAAPSGHEDDLRRLAYELMDAAGLQRGRLTGLAVKGEDLIDADQAPRQLSLDDTREARLVAEGAVDRVRNQVRSPRDRPRRRLPPGLMTYPFDVLSPGGEPGAA